MLNSLRAKLLSIKFRAIRRFVITVLAKIPRDLERAIIFGDTLNHFLMITPFRYFFKFKVPKDIQTNLYDLSFASPLISASFKDDVSSLLQWQLLGIGGITYKTVLKKPSKGNLRPRIQEISYQGEYGILNSLGLPNKGVEKFKLSIPNKKLMNFNRPIGVSIGGNSDKEYFEVFNSIDRYLNSIDYNQFFYEINISCPNTEKHMIGSGLKPFLNSKRNWCIVKLSPLEKSGTINNLYEEGFRQFHASNTLPSLKGGISGKKITPYTKIIIKYIKSNWDDTIVIAGGGIRTMKDVEEYKKIGADHFSVSSLCFNPIAFLKFYNEFSNPF